MGGGGDVPTGGVLLVKAGLYGTVRLTDTLGLTLEGGRVRAPQGSLDANYASATVNWHFDAPNRGQASATPSRTEWVAGVETYDAPRRDGSV